MNLEPAPSANPQSPDLLLPTANLLSDVQIVALRQKAARLSVEIGANLQPGQSIMINYESCHDQMVGDIIEICREKGCGEIFLDRFDPISRLEQIQNGSEDELTRLDPNVVAMYERWYEQRGARIALVGEANPDLFAECDQSRVATFRQAKNAERKLHFEHLVGQNHAQWTLIPAVTDGWASKVFPALDLETARSLLWKSLEACLRLDESDPVAAWKNHLEILEQRADKLNRMKIKELFFSAIGTELRVGLPEQYLFIGGRDQTISGVKFLANMPTEEVFTTPNYRTVDGHITVNAPVLINGQMVKGLKVWIRDGLINRFEAEQGREALEALFKIDPNSRRLGEVALVDSSSRVAQSGIFYGVALCDENAFCHVAIGNGYKKCLTGGPDMDSEALKEVGCNLAKFHYDLTIGARMNTEVLCSSTAEWIEIQRNGLFLI